MGITDFISIILGGISVLLGGFALYQSWKYKKLGDKFSNDQKQIIQAIHDKSINSAIELRHIHEQMTANPNKLNLHKDKLYVYKTSKYKVHNSSEIINKLNKELPKVLKQTYIDSLIANINLDDGSTENFGMVTLRHQYEIEDILKIKELNDIFSEDGLFFEISIS